MRIEMLLSFMLAAGAHVVHPMSPPQDSTKPKMTQSNGEVAMPIRARTLHIEDSETGKALAGAEVRDSITKAVYRTDASGMVVLDSLKAVMGFFYLIEVRHVGYAPVILRLEAADEAPVISLDPAPLGKAQNLAPVVTRAAETTISYNLRDYTRHRMAAVSVGAKFVSPEEVRKFSNMQIGDFLQSRGLTNQRGGCGGAGLSRVGVGVYTDGVPGTGGLILFGPNADRLEKLSAIEFYPSGVYAPPEYGVVGACTLLLLWTKND